MNKPFLCSYIMPRLLTSMPRAYLRVCLDRWTDNRGRRTEKCRSSCFFFFEPRGEVLKDVGLEKKKKKHTHRRNHLTFLSSSQVVLT